MELLVVLIFPQGRDRGGEKCHRRDPDGEPMLPIPWGLSAPAAFGSERYNAPIQRLLRLRDGDYFRTLLGRECGLRLGLQLAPKCGGERLELLVFGPGL